MNRLQRHSNSESNKRKSEPSSNNSNKGVKSRSSSTWNKLKISFSLRKKAEKTENKAEKFEDSTKSESLEFPIQEGAEELKLKTCDEEVNAAGNQAASPLEDPLKATQGSKDSKDSKDQGSTTPSLATDPQMKVSGSESPPPAAKELALKVLEKVEQSARKMDSSVRKAKGIKNKISASKPQSQPVVAGGLRLSAERKPPVIADKLDHKALEAAMKKKQRRDRYLGVAVAYLAVICMLGALVAGLYGYFRCFRTYLEVHKEEIVRMYGEEDSRWMLPGCASLNFTMDMYRKRGQMYEKGRCWMNVSTPAEASWSSWSKCSSVNTRTRWIILKPNVLYSLSSLAKSKLVDVASCGG
ncbi:hypothetical protein L596_022925 [Steinernema carpocapsae]|uniref:Uncharacterized protein n=1 Tax=Steinernema carpocapsae TaxID=34508 RepID=A0A4V6XVT7_STECR|nr:hypothetical protein L596_022925 [Steinernema carpocapsae]